MNACPRRSYRNGGRAAGNLGKLCRETVAVARHAPQYAVAVGCDRLGEAEGAQRLQRLRAFVPADERALEQTAEIERAVETGDGSARETIRNHVSKLRDEIDRRSRELSA